MAEEFGSGQAATTATVRGQAEQGISTTTAATAIAPAVEGDHRDLQASPTRRPTQHKRVEQLRQRRTTDQEDMEMAARGLVKNPAEDYLSEISALILEFYGFEDSHFRRRAGEDSWPERKPNKWI